MADRRATCTGDDCVACVELHISRTFQNHARLRRAAASNERSLPSIRRQEPAESEAAIVVDVVDGAVGVGARDDETPEVAAGGGAIEATGVSGGGVMETAGAALEPQAANKTVHNIPATDLRVPRN